MPRRQYTMSVPGACDPGSKSHALAVALWLIKHYGDKAPSSGQLIRQFGMSRATAYRWCAAYVSVLEQDLARRGKATAQAGAQGAVL